MNRIERELRELAIQREAETVALLRWVAYVVLVSSIVLGALAIGK